MNQAPSTLESTGHYFQKKVSSNENIVKDTYNTEKREEGTLTWKKRGTNDGGESNQRRMVRRSHGVTGTNGYRNREIRRSVKRKNILWAQGSYL